MRKLLVIFTIILALIFCTASVTTDSIEWRKTKITWIDPDTRDRKKVDATALYYNDNPVCVYFPCPKGKNHIDLHTFFYGKTYFFEVENEAKAKEGCLLNLDLLLRGKGIQKEKKYEI